MDEVAIRVSGVSKDFRLPHHKKSNSIKSVFINPLNIIIKKDNTSEVQHALKNISFEVKKGEFFGIVGRNGSGKSTLLKILAGIYQPTKGKVEVNGRLVPFIELGVGFNPELSGRENVYLNGALLGFSRSEIVIMYDDIVAFAELERFMDQKLKNYSSGMQVRLAFSVAIRARSNILLVDEVLAVGDADFQRKCFDYFRELKQKKKTVVFVTHDMNSVREFCDRALLIENSEIKAIGEASKIADSYSQLFSTNSKSSKDLDKRMHTDRWGSEQAKIRVAKVQKKIFNDEDKTILLKVIFQASTEISGYMTGFTAKNATGQTLHGTHTWLEGIELPQLQSGKSLEISWEFPNIYEAGTYTIDVFIFGKNDDIYDTWRGAVSFSVARSKPTGNLLKPPIKFKIKN